jgi:hypothetical protein
LLAITIIDNIQKAEDTVKAVQPQPVLRITDGTTEQLILEKGKAIDIAKEKEKENTIA